MERDRLSRRKVLSGLAVAGLAGRTPAATSPPKRLQVCLMSKFLQFLDLPQMAVKAKDMGFDGIDLCVRPGAHILPERVQGDLPWAVETLRKSGLDVPMITAAIVDAVSPHAEAILRTASGLGIRRYRWGGFVYEADRNIPEQIEELRPRVRALADMNREYNMCAMYHTHSGLGLVGASIWDLWLLLKDFDPRWVSVNYDVCHATIEGGFGGWMNTFRIVTSHLKGVAVKDFKWEKRPSGNWEPLWLPIGGGMVNFKRYLPMLKAAGFDGPVQMHFEYPLGGVELGARQLAINEDAVFTSMHRDLKVLRKWLDEAGL